MVVSHRRSCDRSRWTAVKRRALQWSSRNDHVDVWSMALVDMLSGRYKNHFKIIVLIYEIRIYLSCPQYDEFYDNRPINGRRYAGKVDWPIPRVDSKTDTVLPHFWVVGIKFA